MRIAIVAPPWFEVPPRAYGGIESVCYELVRGLVARGHDVTLIGAGRNHSDARFIATYAVPPSGLGEPGATIHELIHAAKAARAIETIEPDLVHDHSVAGPLGSRRRPWPTVVTVHGPVGVNEAELYRSLAPEVSLVALSRSQRGQAPNLRWAGVVHNGIRVSEYPFVDRKDQYLLFLGRMSPDKGPDLAIDVARTVGLPLVIAAKCTEPEEHAYFEERIRPRLGSGVDWFGEADGNEKKRLLAGARCLLSPLRWDEPFGLVLIEAMACGTPVVALRRGSVPEIVVEGVTGFIRDRPHELPEAVWRTGTIDPLACRTHVERHFTVDQMVNRYERIYSHVRAQAYGEAIRSPDPATGSDPLARSRPQPSLRSQSSVVRRLGKHETSRGSA
jgi:glycosyltransferase involved in cell wall biosynthesis